MGDQAYLDLTTALDRLAVRLGGSLAGEPKRLSGGAALETWAFDVGRTDGVRQLILRRSPSVRADIALPLAEEALVIGAALAAGVHVPTVRLVLDPADGLGEGFVMDRIAGETVPRRIMRELADGGAGLLRQMAKQMARIHTVTPAHLPSLRTIGFADYLGECEAILQRLDRPRPVFAHALRWLDSNAPEPVARPVLVHGDIRVGNLVVCAGRLDAVLDWETAHFGDPMEDLAWFCMPPWRFGAIGKPAGGLGDRRALYDAYVASAGVPIHEGSLRAWSALSSLRWGLACADMANWVISGRDRSLERAIIARRASESELDLLRIIAPRNEGIDA